MSQIETKTSALTIKLSPNEMAAVTQLAEHKEMSPEQVIRQALKLYQLVDHHLATGGSFNKAIYGEPMGCGGDD